MKKKPEELTRPHSRGTSNLRSQHVPVEVGLIIGAVFLIFRRARSPSHPGNIISFSKHVIIPVINYITCRQD